MDLLGSLIDLFTGHGYVAVLVILLVCGWGVPVPEDITLVAGGVIAGLGHANVHAMCAVGVVGVLAGDATMFLAGRHFGTRLLRLRWVGWLLAPRRYARVQRLFARYGNRLMFVARFLPGLRTPIYLSAGMSQRVPFWRFLLLDGLAALLSVPFWVWVGYLGAENHEALLTWLSRGKYGVVLVFAGAGALVVFWLWRRTRRRDHLRAARAQRGSRHPRP